jgi:hypothetical protein
MKDSCHCWQADQGGVVRKRDVTNGLRSVSRRKRRPSSRNLKCLTALKAASSSLSKVDIWSSKILPPHSPSPPGECVPSALVAGGGQTRRAERRMGGGGVNILEDERNRIALLQ